MIGNALRRHRERREYTQAFVAQWIGVCLKTYWSWEHDKTEPSSSELRRIADFFGLTTVDELYRDMKTEVPACGFRS